MSRATSTGPSSSPRASSSPPPPAAAGLSSASWTVTDECCGHALGEGKGVNTGMDIAVDSRGSVCVCGGFSGKTDFDPGPGVFLLEPKGMLNLFVWKLDRDG